MKGRIILFLILFFILIYFIIRNSSKKEIVVEEKKGSILPKIILEEKNLDLKEVQYDEKKYRYGLYEINNIDNLKLSFNLTEKKTGLQVFEENECKLIVNGGFYGEDNKAVGWLQTKEKLERNMIQSSLLDGFLYYDKKLGVNIGFEVNGESIEWGLQNGPMLIFDNNLINLKINNDEENRRVFAGMNQKGNLVFGIVVSEDNLTFGPMLASMPEIVEKIGNVTGNNFVSAINLDGGSASAFITDKIQIRETKLVGSWFCEM